MDSDWCPPLAMPATIHRNVVAMAYLLAEHCEVTWEALDFARSTHKLTPELPLGAPTQAAAPQFLLDPDREPKRCRSSVGQDLGSHEAQDNCC